MFAEHIGSSYKDSEQICKELFKFFATVLFKEKEDILIPRLGTFKHTVTAEKAVRHPATGKMMVIPERDVVKFKRSETYFGKKKLKKSDCE
jgi:nucleoid DNA-binding protein